MTPPHVLPPLAFVDITVKLLTLLIRTGYGNHADYVFGWKGDALQRVLDSPCYVNCPTLETQGTGSMNACKVDKVVDDDIDSCEYSR